MRLSNANNTLKLKKQFMKGNEYKTPAQGLQFLVHNQIVVVQFFIQPLSPLLISLANCFNE